MRKAALVFAAALVFTGVAAATPATDFAAWLDGQLGSLTAKNTAQDATLSDHEARIAALEEPAPPPPPPPPPADTTPPLKPTLSLGPVTQTSMTLNWLPGVDNVGVHHYNVHLNGNKLTELGPQILTYTYTGLSCGTTYAQGLTVQDVAGNTSNLFEATWSRATAACGGSGG